jgi:hypothetical protein
MRVTQEHEAIMAAAAHYFIAVRDYSHAIHILECCQPLTGYPKPTPTAQRQLEAVNTLLMRLFTGYRKKYVPDQPQLAALRKLLRQLRKELIGKTKKYRRMRTIYDLLRHVERRPGFYMRGLSVERISQLIGSVLYPLPLKLTEGDPPFRSFPAWVDSRYPKHQGGGHSWDMVLVNASGGDQEKAFKLFFKELKAFRRSEKGAE